MPTFVWGILPGCFFFGGGVQRNDLDFTDRLWEFCKEANGYLELRNALGLVFRGLQNGSLQPMIHRTNKSMIAEVARRCLPVFGQSGEDAGPSVREMLQKFGTDVCGHFLFHSWGLRFGERLSENV